MNFHKKKYITTKIIQGIVYFCNHYESYCQQGD
jgi:hypothetical protein